jgi:hypothetical protein
MTTLRALVSLLFLALTSALAVAEAPAKLWQPKSGDVISFKVLRDGEAFGSHAVRFSKSADGTLVATTAVSLKAGLGPVTVFRYKLDATETWINGKLVEVSGKVNDNGKKRTVAAKRDGETLKVKGTDFSGAAPAGVVPASHWNFLQTQSKSLLSTEDGEIIKVKISSLGREKIKAGGATLEANRYRLDAAMDVDLWYDDEGRWVKLSFEARGQTIDYILDRMY